MLRAAARRLLLLIGGLVAVVVAVSLGIGALAGANLGRSTSLGLYLVGTLLLTSGVFVGSRGPAGRTSEAGRPGPARAGGGALTRGPPGPSASAPCR